MTNEEKDARLSKLESTITKLYWLMWNKTHKTPEEIIDEVQYLTWEALKERTPE